MLKCCTGYCVDLLNKLASDIGFTYTLYKVRDEKWGLKTENGWNGLVQVGLRKLEIKKNKESFSGFDNTQSGHVKCSSKSPQICVFDEFPKRCVTAFKLNSERARDIDFSTPFLDTGISILVKIRSGVLSPTAFLGDECCPRRM